MQISVLFAEAILDYELACHQSKNFPTAYMARVGLLNQVVKNFPNIANKRKYETVSSIMSILKRNKSNEFNRSTF
jgi:hypothetical protein